MSLKTGNMSELLFDQAAAQPDKLAIVIPHDLKARPWCRNETYTFASLDLFTRTLMAGLRAHNLGPGDRILVLFPVSGELYALCTAIYAIGAVAVLIDPGMGAKRIRQALDTASPKAVISIKAFLKFRWLIPELRKIPLKFSMDSAGWGVKHFNELEGHGVASSASLIPRGGEDQALITFTSGSTGRPKGADRHHAFLWEQHSALKKAYPPIEGQIDMTCLPVVAFHNLSVGNTSIMPDADIARPGMVDPAKVYKQLAEYDVNSLTASPAFLSRIVDYMHENKLELPRMKQLLVGGAPVPLSLQQRIKSALPECTCYVIYGSTEAEPIAHYEMKLGEESQPAFVGGHPAEFIDVRIIDLPLEPIPDGTTLTGLPNNQVGEVIVSGDHVNKGYIDNEQANRENKIRDDAGVIWHRTGDRGYFDDHGTIWLVGRSSDVVSHKGQRFDPFPIESALVEATPLREVALVQTPTGAALLTAPIAESRACLETIQEVLGSHGLHEVPCYGMTSVPMDGRHNSKVDRPLLRQLFAKPRWWRPSPFTALTPNHLLQSTGESP